jgi:Ca2+-binding RTX toxin-like protein
MFDKRRGFRNFGMGLLIFGVSACGLPQEESDVPPSSEGFETANIQPLTAACQIDVTTGNVTLNLAAGETAYLFKRMADGMVVTNALNTSNGECVFPTTKKININSTVASSNNHKVLIDFYGGTFGLATSAASATVGSGPQIVVALGTGTNNTVKVRGTSMADTFTYGTASGTTYLSMAFGTSATALGTARTFPDMSMTGVTDVVACGGPGNDSITGQGGVPIGGTALVPNPLAGTIAMTVYGGAGDDMIVSGAAGTAVNRLYGNAGNDLFPQQAAKAHDVISGSDSGGSDTDTVDYSVRTGALTITLGDDAPASAATGSITLPVQASLVDNDHFTINDGTTSTIFEYQVSGSFGATSGRTTIDVSTLTTAAEVAAATVTAITGLNVTAVQPDVATGVVSVAISTTGPKPAGAAITLGAGSISISDFAGGAAAVTANDGESGELDSLNADIENIIGGPANDVIDCSLATLVPHVLNGMGGNDTLTGSLMADTLWGGTGDDTLAGGGGIDTLNGGDGNDVMQGGLGNDLIDGGGFNCPVGVFAACTMTAAAKSTVAGVNPGLNTLDYADRSVTVTVDLSTLATATTIGATGEKDAVTAGSIAYLRGGSGDDTLTGDINANIIWGGGGADTISGGDGNDALYGEAGNDIIHGGNSDDFVTGGAGTNQLFGDAGNDFVDNTSGTAGAIDCGAGDADIVLLNGSETSQTACEN